MNSFKSRRVVLLFIISILPQIASANFFGPKNVNECIIKSMKNISSDAAAKSIKQSCYDQFTKPLSESENRKLTGRSAFRSFDFGGDIYNGNEHITVTELVVVVKSEKDGKAITRKYRTVVEIPPLTTRSYSVRITEPDRTELSSWWIDSSKGF